MWVPLFPLFPYAPSLCVCWSTLTMVSPSKPSASVGVISAGPFAVCRHVQHNVMSLAHTTHSQPHTHKHTQHSQTHHSHTTHSLTQSHHLTGATKCKLVVAAKSVQLPGFHKGEDKTRKKKGKTRVNTCSRGSAKSIRTHTHMFSAFTLPSSPRTAVCMLPQQTSRAWCEQQKQAAKQRRD